MTSAEDQLKKLLQVAEGKFDDLTQENTGLQLELDALRKENQDLSQSFFDLMDAQKLESEQMVQLTEQIWALEEALAMSREKAMEQMDIMKNKFNSMNDYMKDTLEAATQNASRIELAARVYEMSQKAQIDDIDQQIADFNDQIKPGKL
jgi:predicted nucleotide-binding protein (sugar kinase/HSP70/actin superfamily)